MSTIYLTYELESEMRQYSQGDHLAVTRGESWLLGVAIGGTLGSDSDFLPARGSLKDRHHHHLHEWYISML